MEHDVALYMIAQIDLHISCDYCPNQSIVLFSLI